MSDGDTRPGKHSQFATLNMAIEIMDLPSYKMVDISTVFCMFTAIEIVDFPRKYGDFPSFLVCLPEGFDVLSQRTSTTSTSRPRALVADQWRGPPRSPVDPVAERSKLGPYPT